MLLVYVADDIAQCGKFIRSTSFVHFKTVGVPWIERRRFVRIEYTTNAERFQTDGGGPIFFFNVAPVSTVGPGLTGATLKRV